MNKKEIVKHYRKHFNIDKRIKLIEDDILNIEWADILIKLYNLQNVSVNEHSEEVVCACCGDNTLETYAQYICLGCYEILV